MKENYLYSGPRHTSHVSQFSRKESFVGTFISFSNYGTTKVGGVWRVFRWDQAEADNALSSTGLKVFFISYKYDMNRNSWKFQYLFCHIHMLSLRWSSQSAIACQ